MPLREYTDEMREYRRQHYLDNKEKYRQLAREYSKTKRLDTPKVCGTCFKEKTCKDFKFRTINGRRYLAYECRACSHERDKRGDGYAERVKAYKIRANGRAMADRQNPAYRAKFLFSDLRGLDRRRGLVFNLSLDHVVNAVNLPCSYCLRVGQKMTLDRIDNSIGHVIGNVNPCCCTCNYFRRDMPYTAWMKLIPALRSAFDSGDLDGWFPGPQKTLAP